MVPPSTLDAVAGTAHDAPPHGMSEEEFVTWAFAHDVRAEWVNGEVIVMSPASFRHVEITQWLIEVLRPVIRSKKLGKLAGPDFLVRLQNSGASRRVPDLLFISQANLFRLKPNHLDGPPDLAIEIVSPESVARDWRDKFLEYEEAGVREYWIIDPTSETFEASVLNADGKFAKVALDANGVLHSAIVPGFWFKPEWFFLPELPDATQHLRDLGVI